MSLCINPSCPQPNHPENGFNRYCQKCGSDLLLEKRYRVLRLLSNNSGFGDIYEAYETGSPKILKVLKQEHNNQTKVVELFQKEAEVLGQLNHPGIPKVEGYFQHLTKTGLPVHCIVMEKIEGLNLEEWLEKQGNKGINQELAINWLKQVAEILQLVHEKQFFHRDIKPGNIMMRSDGRLVLIDFGTAREATFTYLAKVGMGGGVTGVVSAGYTPPEQQNGHALPQSDFFALGRTFVHLLTGRHPLDFYDANDDVLRWHRHVFGVSSLLLDFIDELMALKPNQRPLNTQVVLQRIGELESRIIKKEIKPDFIPVVQPTLSQKKSIVSQIIFSIISYFGWRFTIFYASGILLLIGLEVYKLLQPTHSVSYQINNRSVSDQKTNRVDFSSNTLTGHSSLVNSVVISPDRKTLVSGSFDKTIKIWNLTTGNLIRTISGHTNGVISLAISRDGQTLGTGSFDKTIKIWNLKRGILVRTLSGHFNKVISVAISPGGQTLVTGSADDTIKIWNLQTGKLIRTLSGHSGRVNSIAISPDGQTLVSGSRDKTIKIWNLQTGDLIRTLSGHSDYVNSVAISPDGQTLVSGSSDKTIRIWNLQTGKLIDTLSGHSSPVYSVAISTDGQTLVSGSWDKTIKIWRVK